MLAAHRLSARFGAVVRRIVLDRVKDFTDRVDDDERTDAEEDAGKRAAAKRLAKTLGDRLRSETANLTAGDWEAAGEAVVTKTYGHSKKEFRRLGIPVPDDTEERTDAKSGAKKKDAKKDAKKEKEDPKFRPLGVDIRKIPTMRPLIDGWRKDNVALIKNMHKEQVDKVERILDEGWGRHPRSIAQDIEERIGVSKSRAELIARDQVLTLHAKITRHRQRAAGIDSYIWTTSQDERVREAHAELEGEEFSWDEGGDPEEGHPGEAVNCRCVAFPVLEELED